MREKQGKDVAAKRKSKRLDGRNLVVHLIGLAGLACIIVAVVGLVYSLDGKDGSAPVASLQDSERGVNRLPYYPLEVGRYWIYVHRGRDGITEVERRIVRRESRSDQELFFFSDGSMAYREDGKIFETGPKGGVNVVPVDFASQSESYVYRSQGLHIEKRIGARDTIVVLDGHRYQDCVQVITRFRPVEEGDEGALSYASYYVRGIGLVGREAWPRQADYAPSVVLRDFGPQRL